jgi:hypothetical protein
LNVLQECKKKKCTSQKKDPTESVEIKQKKTSKVTTNNKTQGKKQPRSTKGKKDKVENQSTVDGKDIEIMSDSRPVEGKKVKKPKVDLPIIFHTVCDNSKTMPYIFKSFPLSESSHAVHAE